MTRENRHSFEYSTVPVDELRFGRPIVTEEPREPLVDGPGPCYL